jgi:hypothetical protein
MSGQHARRVVHVNRNSRSGDLFQHREFNTHTGIKKNHNFMLLAVQILPKQ